MGLTKVPRPDGLPLIFFQSDWSIVKEEVVETHPKFFSFGVFMEGINDTNLVLIPKKKECLSPTDFRSIALCNVIYKAVAKILANRIRPLLDSCISPHQVAFIPGKQILIIL